MTLDAAALEYQGSKERSCGPYTHGSRTLLHASPRGWIFSEVGSRKNRVEEMIAAKAQKGLSRSYIADLRYRLGALAKAFHCDVNAIFPDDLRAFLNSLALAPRGFNNMLCCMRTFFSFAQERGWLSRDADLLTGIEKRREKAVPVQIFTSAEMDKLLTHCSPELRPCLAVAALAGLRTEEILRLDWSDTRRRSGFIEIEAEKAKTAARRLVPIAPNLARWLAPYRRSTGSVWPYSKPWFFESLRDTVKRINENRKSTAPRFSWKANALRHSFISYRLVAIQDVNRLALEAGNSPKMIFQHYRELCTPQEARAWFALAPKSV